MKTQISVIEDNRFHWENITVKYHIITVHCVTNPMFSSWSATFFECHHLVYTLNSNGALFLS